MGFEQVRLPKEGQFSQMTFGGGLQTGNSMIDMLLNMFLGNKLAPAPGGNQSILDAYNLRERSRDYMSLMRKSFGTSMLAQHLGGPAGINTDSMIGGLAAQMLGMSGIMDNPLLQAMNGGNPIKAMMGLKANMTGMTMGQGFGHIGLADNATVESMYKGMEEQLFKKRTVTAADLAEQQSEKSASLLKSLKEDQRKRLTKYIKKDKDGKELFDFDAFSADDSQASSQFDDALAKRKNILDDYSKEAKKLDEARSDFVKQMKDISPEEAGKQFDTTHTAEIEDLKKKFQKSSDAFKELQDAKSTYIKDLGDAVSTTSAVLGFRSQLGQQVNQAADPKATRGFKIQDLTRSSLIAIDLNMASLGFDQAHDKRIPVEEKAHQLSSNFTKFAIPAISAFRDLTGAETAEEAMENMNSLMGNAKMNIGTEEGGKEMESLARRVKATARTAGIGITSMLEIIRQIKELSAAHPELAYTGGDVHMETAIRAAKTTAALSATMGAGWIRQNGGQAAVSQMVTENLAEAATQPITDEIYGIVGLIAGDASLLDKSPTGKGTRRDYILAELNKWNQNQESALGKADHGFSGADKAYMKNRVAELMGQDVSRVYNASYSASSSMSGRQFAQGKSEYDFTAAGGHGAAYDYFFRAIQQDIMSQGLDISDDELVGIMHDVKQEFSNVGRGEGLLADIYSKTRTTKNGKKFTVSLGDYTLSEQNAANKELVFAATLHDRLTRDPNFAAEYKNMDVESRKYAVEEARLDSEMAQLRQPIIDTVVQAYMSGQFSKGKDELLALISTPDAKARGSSMLDMLNSNSSTTTASSFKNVMLEALGGHLGLSEEDVNANLALAGITDAKELAAIHAKRRQWSENSTALNAFDKATKNNTVYSIYDAAKQLKAGKLTDDQLEKLGLDRTTVEQAGQMMDIIGEDTVKRFGGYTGEEFMKAVPMRDIISHVAHLGYESTKKNVLSLTENELSGYYQGQEATSQAGRAHDQLKLLADAGYIKRKKGNTGNTWNDFDWGKETLAGLDKLVADRERTSALDGSKLDSLLTTKGMADVKAAYSSADGMSANDKEYLAKNGIVKLDKDGKIVSWDDTKLNDLATTRKGLKVASENTLVTKNIAKLDEAKSELDGKLQQADDKLLDEMKHMTKSFDAANKEISESIRALTKVLTGALS